MNPEKSEEPLSRSDQLKEQMISEWSMFVGPIPMPRCAECQTDVNNLSLDVSLDREEYLIKTSCHGDTQIYHIPFWYTALIAHQLSKRASQSGAETKDLRWTLPEAFTKDSQRVDGMLHFDFFESLSKKVMPKRTEPISESEAVAKKEFEDEFEFEKKRGHVISVDTNNKPI